MHYCGKSYRNLLAIHKSVEWSAIAGKQRSLRKRSAHVSFKMHVALHIEKVKDMPDCFLCVWLADCLPVVAGQFSKWNSRFHPASSEENIAPPPPRSPLLHPSIPSPDIAQPICVFMFPHCPVISSWLAVQGKLSRNSLHLYL